MQRIKLTIEIITVVLLFCTARYAYSTWQEMIRSTEAATRAWVGPFKASIRDLNSATPSIIIDYKNSGKEPAVDFGFETSGGDSWAATITSRRPKDPIFKIDNECMADNEGNCATRIRKWVEACKAKQIEENEAVFPDAVYSYSAPFALKKAADISGPNRAIFFQGCFVYRSSITGSQTHHSAFCYFYRNGMSNDERMTPCPAAGYAD